jgi:hypothetical protein
MQWHRDRFGESGAEVRLLDHSLYLIRDGLETVSGTDESGHMNAMGLAWVAMMPEGFAADAARKTLRTGSFVPFTKPAECITGSVVKPNSTSCNTEGSTF